MKAIRLDNYIFVYRLTYKTLKNQGHVVSPRYGDRWTDNALSKSFIRKVSGLNAD